MVARPPAGFTPEFGKCSLSPMGKFKDISKQRFGRLIAIRFLSKAPKSHSKWLCQCDCGKQAIVSIDHLSTGHTKSCGCLEIESKRLSLMTHGNTANKYQTPEYTSWRNMLNRCKKDSGRDYIHYKGRGIKVCDRWKESFQNFLSDMGKKPSKGMSIDRINNNGDYEPGNCRWANQTMQSNNMSTNRLIELNGKRQTVSLWGRELGLNPASIRYRLDIGWSPELALTTPMKQRNNHEL